MSYPGNASLSRDIQARIRDTFRQTLDLAERGSRQEALLGCDFILRLDPLFEPARTLLDRLQGEDGGVAVEDLRGFGTAPASEASFADVEAELTAGGAATGTSGAVAATPAATQQKPRAASEAAAGDLQHRLEEALEARRFRAVAELAEANRQALRDNPELRRLVEAAHSRQEAEPYVKGFLDSARHALQEGRGEETERLLAKARLLDPSHPGIADLEAAREHYSDPSRRMGSRRRGIELEEAPEEQATEEATEVAGETDGASETHEPQSPDEGTPYPWEIDAEGGEVVLAAADTTSSAAQPTPGAGEPQPTGGDQRIDQLLAEGQAAFDRKDYQAAIDAWSRIFLIDIDHPEANRRIEAARKLKAEGERQLEEEFHEGLAHLEAEEAEAAKSSFRKVLALEPNHLAAKEYLERLEAGEMPVPAETAEAAPSEASTALPDLANFEESAAAGEPLKHEILVPPEPGEAQPREVVEAPTLAGRRAGMRRSFVYIGSAVLALVLVGAWYLYNHRGQIFHNVEVEATTPTTPAPDPIARARKLHDAGRGAIAIAQLRRIPPEDPQYSQAQVLIAQWEAEGAPQPPAPQGPSASELEHRSELVATARSAYQEGEYLRASDLLDRAGAIAPLEDDLAELAQGAQRRLAPLSDEIALFRQGDWEFVLPRLWRIHEKDGDNVVVTRLIVDSYYNLGVRDLQRGEPTEAEKQFGEALRLAPSDDELGRLHRFAVAYEHRGQDLLYRIFVKYLPFR